MKLGFPDQKNLEISRQTVKNLNSLWHLSGTLQKQVLCVFLIFVFSNDYFACRISNHFSRKRNTQMVQINDQYKNDGHWFMYTVFNNMCHFKQVPKSLVQVPHHGTPDGGGTIIILFA